MYTPTPARRCFFGRPLSADEFGVKQAVGFASGGFGFHPLKRLAHCNGCNAPLLSELGRQTAYRRYLALFALDENKRVKELSEGMKVKYALALALSHRARLLVLDEPTSGLDPVSRDELLEIFLQLAQDEGISILFSTVSPPTWKNAPTTSYTCGGARWRQTQTRTRCAPGTAQPH